MIETEVHKLIKCGFMREEQHPDKLANIVSILKNNGKIRVCIDFHDLKATYPKDKFLLPIIDIVINSIYDFERMSFIFGFLRYNQIKIYPDDGKHTLF